MAEAIAAAAAWAANAVSGAVYSGLTAVGVSTATAATISTYAASITAVAVATIAQVGPALLFRPNIPSPEFARQVKRQPIPDRMSAYGRVRLGGGVMLYEAVGNKALIVVASHDGLIDGWEEIYLNDNVVTVLPSGFVQSGSDMRYGKFSDLVEIDTRVGLPTETNYSQITALAPSLWPANARGDGVASLMMICAAGAKELFTRDYPNGLPVPSGVARTQLCWDARLGPRGTITDDADKLASVTWGFTMNPVWHLLDYMTNPVTGMGLPLSKFDDNIADWITAADVCDEAVALAAGGTVARYQSSGAYLHSTAPADVIATILATFDGWLAQDAYGVFTVQAGKYYEPTVTITDAHIVALSRQFWVEDEKAVNEMVGSFTDPSFDYTEVETDPWRNEADIAARNGEVRSQRLALPWVPNNSQARRLLKIASAKASAPIRGTITTTLDGLRAWSERRIRIQAPSDSETMADIVVDVFPLTLNSDMTVSIPFQSCDATAYDWNAATEEGAGAGTDTRPPPEPLVQPIIASATHVSVPLTDGSDGSRIHLEVTAPQIANLTWFARTRISGSTDGWFTETFSDVPMTDPYVLDTGFVQSDASVDVQVAYQGAGPLSEWSATETVVTSAATPLGRLLFNRPTQSGLIALMGA